MINKDNYSFILNKLKDGAALIAVSKTKPVEDIMELYHLGHRDFGENKVQELLQKKPLLPADIRWHLIGHLQTNKVKQILPHVHLLHTLDSFKLMDEIEKQAEKLNIDKVNCLIEVHIAKEESKTGFDINEIDEAFIKHLSAYKHIRFTGLMGIATHTEDEQLIEAEFMQLKNLLNRMQVDLGRDFKELSIGMSSDYPIALKCGATYIRVGSLLFGERNYN